MISLADKLVACGDSRPQSPFFIAKAQGATNTGFEGVTASSDGTRVAGVGITYTATYSVPVVVLDGTGSLLWQRNITSGVSVSTTQQKCCFDSSGNLYVMVTVTGKGIILKYNTVGVLQWQREIGGGTAIACNAAGDVYVLALKANATSDVEAHLIKYNTSGVLQWQTKATNGTDHAYLTQIAVDGSDTIFTSGYTYSGTIIAANVIRKYNNAGGLLASYAFEKLTPTSINQAAPLLAIDPSSNVYLQWGYTRFNGVDNDGICVVAKFNSSLVLQWAKTITAAGTATTAYGIAADANNVYCNWYSGSPTEYRLTALTASTGDHLLTRKFTATSAERGFVGLCAVNNSVYVASAGLAGAAQLAGVIGCLDTVGMTGTYGTYFAITEPTAPTFGTATFSTYAISWTQSTGTATDVAGSLTDAAGSLSITSYPKD